MPIPKLRWETAELGILSQHSDPKAATAALRAAGYWRRSPGSIEARMIAMQNARLQEDNAALRKDAERYRWLRDVASGDDWENIGQTAGPTNTDALIDERMAAYQAAGAA